ncbi:MAG: hypothetical protein QOE92_1679 [Chloroflexota bacterium]|jgi:hypothetical protein|nr:hypothetical protein [Chloroflexota bacterium]
MAVEAAVPATVVTVTFELTPGEYRGAVLRYLFTQPAYVALASFILVFIVFTMAAGVATGRLLVLLPDVVMAVILEALLVAVPLLAVWWYRWRWGGFEMTATFSEAGIEAKMPRMGSQFAWSKFSRAKRLKGYYELRQDLRRVAVVPARAFKSAEERAAFETLLERHLKFKGST